MSPYAVHDVVSRHNVPHPVARRLIADSSDSNSSAPSTISSRHTLSDGSTTGKSSSDGERTDPINTFSQQLHEYRQGGNRLNISQVLGGDIGFMANPKLNKALFKVSEIL